MITMHSKLWILLGVLLVLSACSTTQPPPWDSYKLKQSTSERLTRFKNKQEFDYYRQLIIKTAERYEMWGAEDVVKPALGLLAQAETEELCAPGDPICGDEVLEEITVTGTKSSSSSSSKTSITNNQEASVDEGDIVKLYKNFLIVLQDGRLFSVKLGALGERLQLIDRIDIYQDKDADAWYDELLISNNHLVVTAYNYSLDQSDIDIFKISDDGIMTRVVTYSIQSYDYYSSDNYATRMVNGQLVLYTPIPIFNIEPEEEIDLPKFRVRRPGQPYSDWQPLFDYNDIYWPVSPIVFPVVHTISVCPIDDVENFECRSTGMIGGDREFYVSESSAYLWTASEYELQEYFYQFDIPECQATEISDPEDFLTADLYKLDLQNGDLSVVQVAGVPLDQFSLDERESGFLALVRWLPRSCDGSDADEYSLRFINVPKSAFGKRLRSFNVEYSYDLGVFDTHEIENRFAENHLIFATRDYWKGPPFNYWNVDVIDRTGQVHLMRLDQPGQYSSLNLEHDAQRLELFGEGFIVDGYTDDTGLQISTVDLRSPFTLAGTLELPYFYESEGRSHAINMIVDENSSGMFGLPVAQRQEHRYRYRDYDRVYYYLEEHADVSFFDVESDLSFRLAGMLRANPDSELGDYECEMSCYGWYGNARPIFIDGRIFALSGSELMEGAYNSESLYEIDRVSLQDVPVHQRIAIDGE